MHADSLSKCGGPKLTCTLERTAANPALRIICDARLGIVPGSETSSFQSIARSTSRYFESLDSRAPGHLRHHLDRDVVHAAPPLGQARRRNAVLLVQLRPSRTNVTPPFSVTHASTGVIFMNA